MSCDNPLWGAPRIHGELLKLGLAVGETSVSKYMIRNRKPPNLLINWGLPFFLRFPCWPPLLALAAAFWAFFRQRAALQLEILALRHQLGVLQRSVKRPKLTAADRFL